MNATQIYKHCNPSVVHIWEYTDQAYLKAHDDEGSGSGWVYKTAKGTVYIVTAKHVISDKALYQVEDSAGHYYTPIDSWQCPTKDIGVLKIQGWIGPVHPLHFAAAAPAIGTTVFNVGYPLDFTTAYISRGYVSSGKYNGWVTTFLDSTFGDSGSPVLNAYGQVIGLFVAGSDQYQRMNFSIPAATVSKTLKSVI